MMRGDFKIPITLFFTGGVSLASWKKTGNLAHEIEVYQKLSREVGSVQFITYGGEGDRALSKEVNPILLFSCRWFQSAFLTAASILIGNFKNILNTKILKTNQLRGYRVPFLIKKLLGKKLLVRCGYLPHQLFEATAENREELERALRLEKEAFRAADLGIVTSERDRTYLVSKYQIPSGKIRVIPNFVNTGIFRPLPEVPKKYDLVYVGRDTKQKNLSSLFKAFRGFKTKSSLKILLIGSCCHSDWIQTESENEVFEVTLAGSVSNEELPKLLNQARIFVLPSLWEGHPKTLLEAMSCGLACLGSDVPGIREDIQHLKTGFLCKPEPPEIASAIGRLLGDGSLISRLGVSAREYVKANYDFLKIYELEKKTLQELAGLK